MSSRKIKVLVLTSSFPRYKNDWWQQAVLSIYAHMDKNKYKITVIAPSGPGAKSSEDFDGIKIKRFSYFYPPDLQLLTSGEGILYTSGKRKIIGKIQVFTFITAELFLTLKTIFGGNYDIIHANWILPQGLIAIVAKFIFRIPVVVTVHGSDIFTLNKFNFIKALILKFCDYCTTNSSATYDVAYKIYPTPKIKIVQMGVEVRAFDPKYRDESWRKEFGDKPKIILGVGRLIKWKGFEYLIRAFPRVLAKFPQAKLVILGKGPEEENLRETAKKLNLEIGKNLFFLGTFGPDKMPTIYASSDLVVCPSITNVKTGEREGQGNVVLEARASGVPIIASRSGGLVDTIDGKTNGLFFEERNYKELAQKIIYIFSSEEVWKNLSKNGLKYVREKFPWRKTSQKFEELYEDTINR